MAGFSDSEMQRGSFDRDDLYGAWCTYSDGRSITLAASQLPGPDARLDLLDNHEGCQLRAADESGSTDTALSVGRHIVDQAATESSSTAKLGKMLAAWLNYYRWVEFGRADQPKDKKKDSHVTLDRVTPRIVPSDT